MARDFDFFGFGLALACVEGVELAGVVDLASVVEAAGLAAFGASAGFVSVCFWAVSVAMVGSSVSGAW